MQNIFPIAQKAVIEETIGITRPSASPPKDQGTKESSIEIKRASRLNVKPSWFSISEISEKEKNMLKGIHISYFKNSENREQEYFELRDFILKGYESTGEYLPLQFVTKTNNYLLATIAFNFLEDNKIINYNIDLLETIDSLDRIVEEAFSSDLLTDSQNNNIPKTIENDSNINSNAELKNKESQNFFEAKETRKVKEKYFKREMLEEATCSCRVKASYFTSDLLFICESCFLANRFPSKYSSRNFHKLTPELLNCIWTKQEEFKLLKNIEMYGDAWDKVTEGLNKSFEQCIFHFIKMPIVESVTHYPSIPFTQIPNSISTLIAFTCSLVYPSIATELSKVALQNINHPDLMYILLDAAHKKGKEVLEMEKAKIEKLGKVELEALVKLLMLKIEAICEMNVEIQAVKSELEDERERLLEEFTKLK